jgi:hypothetical protein
LATRRRRSASEAASAAGSSRSLSAWPARSECGDLYDDRCALVHGAGVDLSQPHERSTFEQGFIALQETLRRAVRRAFEDRSFAAVFEDDACIPVRWSVVVTRHGTSCAI